MIDWQRDFVQEGGFGATLGNDVALLKAGLPGAQRLLAAARAAGLLVVHTLEAHKPDLSGAPRGAAPCLGTGYPALCYGPPGCSTAAGACIPSLTRPPCAPPPADLPASKLTRGNLPPGLRIGDDSTMGRILIAGEPGNGIVDEVAPIEVRAQFRRYHARRTTPDPGSAACTPCSPRPVRRHALTPIPSTAPPAGRDIGAQARQGRVLRDGPARDAARPRHHTPALLRRHHRGLRADQHAVSGTVFSPLGQRVVACGRCRRWPSRRRTPPHAWPPKTPTTFNPRAGRPTTVATNACWSQMPQASARAAAGKRLCPAAAWPLLATRRTHPAWPRMPLCSPCPSLPTTCRVLLPRVQAGSHRHDPRSGRNRGVDGRQRGGGRCARCGRVTLPPGRRRLAV